MIKTPKGASIQVDQHKVEDKDRILKRGEKIHKRLEREIHPDEVIVRSTTVEETWAIRLLNMLSSLEALLTLGKCREMPISGFVGDVYVSGIIDEIVREPIDPTSNGTTTRRQSSLNEFFGGSQPRTHRLIISDSKTRASGSLPKPEDTLAGRYQVMLYKELLDALLVSTPAGDSILPTSATGGFAKIFDHLGLDPRVRFSNGFRDQAQAIVVGNGLRWGVRDATCLLHLTACWSKYVHALGLGTFVSGKKEGLTDDQLELVYRRAGHVRKATRKRRKKGNRKERRSRRKHPSSLDDEGDLDLQKAIRLSLEVATDLPPASSLSESQVSAILGPPSFLPPPSQHCSPLSRNDSKTSGFWDLQYSEQDREDDELALAIELSLTQVQGPELIVPNTTVEVPVLSSQESPTAPSSAPLPASQRSQTADAESDEESGTKSGSVIGRSRFTHDPTALAKHLAWTLEYWQGKREPLGVTLEQTRRCAWCEFEDGCEWREAKAREVLQANRSRRLERLHTS